MNLRLPCFASVTILTLLAACAQPNAGARQPDPAHGRYLVEQVGMCHDCHSPRNAKGEFLREQWLSGAPLPFQPTVEMPWAPVAPPLAGLPSLSDEQAAHFLTTGELPGGRKPRPPMPEFRFDGRDAQDVVAYLRSLRPRVAKSD